MLSILGSCSNTANWGRHWAPCTIPQMVVFTTTGMPFPAPCLHVRGAPCWGAAPVGLPAGPRSPGLWSPLRQGLAAPQWAAGKGHAQLARAQRGEGGSPEDAAGCLQPCLAWAPLPSAHAGLCLWRYLVLCPQLIHFTPRRLCFLVSKSEVAEPILDNDQD